MIHIVERLNELDQKKQVFILVNIVIVIFYFFLNRNTGLFSDDFRTMHIWSNPDIRVSTLFDAIRSSNEYYMAAGGRWISYFLASIFLIGNKMWFDIVNTLFSSALGILIYIFVCRKKQISSSLIILIHVFLWTFTPVWGEEFLWISGSTMYLWTIVFELAFAWHFWKRIKTKSYNDRDSHWTSIPFMIVLGIFAGLSLEPLACTMVIAIILYIVYIHKIGYAILKSDIAGIIGFFIGFFILMAAPGNYLRAAGVQEGSSIIFKYLYRFARETYYSIAYMLVPLGLSIMVYTIVIIRNKKESVQNNNWILVFIGLAIISIYVMTFSAGFAIRIFLTPTVLIGIAFFGTLNQLIEAKKGVVMFFSLVLAINIMLQGVALTMINKEAELPIRVNSIYVDAMSSI